MIWAYERGAALPYAASLLRKLGSNAYGRCGSFFEGTRHRGLRLSASPLGRQLGGNFNEIFLINSVGAYSPYGFRPSVGFHGRQLCRTYRHIAR
ncbi:hypothetical protein [Treponema endosymbiont of Eucomonympha sp.]|uniref:hypothetical protein n=1 Tax=Treponema endosymbiont of Eucomonympha sp. TaxID=1580831 RepID=UPI000A98BF80|nr:hypothetical protein [Treponema endosymbiont of Eucomonympha sp.]